MDDVWNWVIFFLTLIALAVMIIYQVIFYSFWCKYVLFLLFSHHLGMMFVFKYSKHGSC